jgi:hypothetical protein
LVSEQELKVKSLRSSLPAVTNVLSRLQQQSPTTSRIVEYRGIDGLKQMNFNLTKADGEYRVMELTSIDKLLGAHFANKMRARTQTKGTRTYVLTNNSTGASEPGIAATRFIDPKVFEIQTETFIYNNCVALLSYNQDDMFGIEFYSDKLAAQHKQLFDLLWSQAVSLKG